MRFTAFTGVDQVVLSTVYYSVGGGFVVEESEIGGDATARDSDLPHPFESARDLLGIAARIGGSVSDVVMANERHWRSEAEIRSGLLHRWEVMQQCIDRGCRNEGILPGGLRLQRRAPALFQKVNSDAGRGDPLVVLDWVDLVALAVGEENAAGQRIVTAPTNGAAGIIPAVLYYYTQFCPGADESGIVRFLLTAGAIAILYKKKASLSGAEVGCQGEVGVACSMAAGALTEVLGGSIEQVAQAAEIGMEHNLGLTCDPVMGLVQIPCIERNTMGAVKAINAARLALRSEGTHRVSLDRVIAVMRETGSDMASKYKETSEGGLAVNVSEC